MKKKFRNITVDGIEYAWSLGKHDYDFGEQEVNIWKDKKKIHSFWTSEESIKPQLIAETIKDL